MSNYRVVIRGVQAGQSADAVASALAQFSKKTPDKLRSLLLSGRDLVAKRTPDMQPALRYKQMLEKMGCACVIEAEIVARKDKDVSNSITTSITSLTMPPSTGTTAPRDYNYGKTPIGLRLREIARLLRFRELTGLAVLASVLYYGWTNNLLDDFLRS